MAPKQKPDGDLGSLEKNLKRVKLKLDGELTSGPCRATIDDAEEDLRAMRALQRCQMPAFLARLKEGLSREDAAASAANASQLPHPNSEPSLGAEAPEARLMSCSDGAGGADQLAQASQPSRGLEVAEPSLMSCSDGAGMSADACLATCHN